MPWSKHGSREISCYKQHYQASLLKTYVEEGFNFKYFWKEYSNQDANYDVASAWEKLKLITPARFWNKILPDVNEGKFPQLLQEEFPGISKIDNPLRESELCSENVSQWLKCGKDELGFEHLIRKEINSWIVVVEGDKTNLRNSRFCTIRYYHIQMASWIFRGNKCQPSGWEDSFI